MSTLSMKAADWRFWFFRCCILSLFVTILAVCSYFIFVASQSRTYARQIESNFEVKFPESLFEGVYDFIDTDFELKCEASSNITVDQKQELVSSLRSIRPDEEGYVILEYGVTDES